MNILLAINKIKNDVNLVNEFYFLMLVQLNLTEFKNNKMNNRIFHPIKSVEFL